MFVTKHSIYLYIFYFAFCVSGDLLYAGVTLSGRESRFSLDSGASLNLRSAMTGYTGSSISKRQTATISTGYLAYATVPLDLTDATSCVAISLGNTITSSFPTLFGLSSTSSNAIVTMSSKLTSSLPTLFSLTNANSFSIVSMSNAITSSFPTLFLNSGGGGGSSEGDPNFTTSNAIVYFSSILTNSLPFLFGLVTSDSSTNLYQANLLTNSLPALFALTTACSYAIIRHDTMLTSSLPALFSLTNAGSNSIVYQNNTITSSFPTLFGLSNTSSNAIVTMNNLLTSSLPALFSLTNSNSASIVYQTNTITSSFPTLFGLSSTSSNAIVTMNNTLTASLPALFSLTNAGSQSIVYHSQTLTSSLPALFALTNAGSQAIVYHSQTLTSSLPALFSLTNAGSQAIVYHSQTLTSSLPALFALTNAGSQAIVYHSQTLTSSLPALFSLTNAGSQAIVYHSQTLTSSLPALFALTNAGSQAIVYHSQTLTSSLPALFALTNAGSQAIVYHSQTLTSSLPSLFSLTVANSYAIYFVESLLQTNTNVTLGSFQAQISTIDRGLTNIVFFDATATMSYDINLSVNHMMYFVGNSLYGGPVNNILLNGNGYAINFSSNLATLLQVESGITTTVSNVYLSGIRSEHIKLVNSASRFIFGDKSIIDLKNSQDLSQTMSFAGSAVVNGNGKTITLQPNGNFITLPGSTLTLRNMTLRGVKDNNIRCLDSTAKIVFDNVRLVLDSNFSFTVGSFEVNDLLSLTGTSVFVYKSPQVSKILGKSKLYLDRNTTFSYNPPSTNKALLTFADASSIFHLNGSTLYTTMTGMQLTVGTMMIENTVKLQNEAKTVSGAILFGNGIAADDLTIVMLPGSKLSLETGFLDYQNTQ